MDNDIIVHTLFWCAFLWINFMIIYQDIKYKVIKNIFIILLLLLFWLFYIFSDFQYNIFFFLYFFINVLILLILYGYKILPGWDIKYILVLSLFLWDKIGYFLWGISIVIFCKILIESIVYVTKVWVKKFFNISNDFSLLSFVWKIAGILNIFFIIQILYGTIYFLGYWEFIQSIYVFWTISMFIFISIFKLGYKKILSDTKYKNIILWIIYTSIFLVFLYGLFNQYILFSWQQFFFFILTISLISWLIGGIRIMIEENEQKFIHIDELKAGMKVDKDFLMFIFWQYNSIVKLLVEKKIIRWKKFFDLFQNPVTYETAHRIKKIYHVINQRNIEEKNGYTILYQIKIYNSFSFWPYIFLVFLWLYIFHSL